MRRPRAALPALMLLAALVALPAERADAQQTPARLVSNLGEVAAAEGILGIDYAQAFTTGSNHGGYTLTGVDLRIQFGDVGVGSHPTVTINHGTVGPGRGTVAGTLTNPDFAVSSTPAKHTFTHAGLKLDPDTTYYVVVDVGSGSSTSNSISMTASDAENAGGAPGWSIANGGLFQSGGSLNVLSDGRSLHVGVTGTALPAPPPTPPGAAATLSNLDEADGAAHSLTSDRAVSFRTGGNGDHHVLESVELSVVRVTDSRINQGLRVRVLADSGGAPDLNRALTTLTAPTLAVSNTERTYTFTYAGGDGSGLRLEPETTYWVVALDSRVVYGHTIQIRGTTSASERLVGLPAGWSIGNNHRTLAFTDSNWGTHSEPLKVRLSLGAADDPFVQFRTCEGAVSGNDCDTGWVVANYTRHDPPPTITLMEGGATVTYQWRVAGYGDKTFDRISDQVGMPGVVRQGRTLGGDPVKYFDGRIGPGGSDKDRLICHTGVNQHGFMPGDPIDSVDTGVPAGNGTNNWHLGNIAGEGLDRHSGCPFRTQAIYWHEREAWRPVSVAAGEDSDAFDHVAALWHSPSVVGSNFEVPAVGVPLVIRDDDEWEQDLEFSVDDGATWTSLEDGGLSLAFPPSLNNGTKAHYFWVRLRTDPATLGAGADQTKRFSVTAHHSSAPISSGTLEEWRSYDVWLTSPAASHLHSFRAAPEAASTGSVTVSRTPIQVEINVGDNYTGNIRFEVQGYKLYERNDSEISTATPPVTVRTKSFNFDGVLGSCVGCQLLPGDLPEPVVERVGEVAYANLSDTGIDLSWPRVVGAEGYEVRWWSTTPLFEGYPAEDAWFGAEPDDPSWGIRELEPDTEYRAVVYYKDHGATQLSTASPVLRFTTLSAGDPVQAEPDSIVVERVPEVSISAADGTVEEGGAAAFTVTAEPAPDAPLDVRVRVAAPAAGGVVDGSQLGERWVNVPTTGSATFTIPTLNDAGWGSNGSLHATVEFGDGYRRSRFDGYATVYIANNDLPPPPKVQLKRVSDTTATIAWKPQDGVTKYLVGWHKAFSGIPVLTEVTVTGTEHQITGLDPDTLYTVFVIAGKESLRPDFRVRTLAAGAAAQAFEVDFDTPPPNTASGPVVSITGAAGGAEGAPVTFTVAADPAPAADLPVGVTVATTGDFGYGALPSSVTIPASGSATVTVTTTDDDADEADGSVTLTLNAGSGYLLGARSSATADVTDDDAKPTVGVIGGFDVTEGGDATFTVTASPAPAADLAVNVTVSASGDYGATTGQRTVTVPTSGSATFTVGTTDDDADEADGSVTATVDAGGGYTVSAAQGAATVGVADNDDEDGTGHTVDPDVIAKVRDLASQTQHGTAHVNRWNRVLVAFGEHDGTGVTGGAMTAAEAQDMADRHSSPVWDEVVAELTALEASAQADPPPPTPEVSVTGGSGVTEGGDATFTVTASPAPTAGLAVSVTVSASGDYGAATGRRTVTVPTSGSVTFTVGTTDDNADEADGSVTATVDAGSGYTVSPAQGAATVAVADDDPAEEQTGHTVDPDVIAKVQDLASQTQHGTAHVNRWNRVLVAFGEHDGTGVTGGAMTAAEAQDMADRHSSPVWDEVVAELTALEAASAQADPPPPTPEVSVSAGSGVTEGGDATFTVTASPAPAADLSVSVTVSQSGDYGAATGQRTVTVPTSGSATFTVGTTDDSADETDGSVTATVDAGSGYTVSPAQGAATVAVADDDDPPPTPEVSVTGGNGVTEGGDASFTVTASPAPASNLSVSVTVSASGDYGATTGARTVTVPTSGSATFTVGTTDDSADETDGSVTATVNAGSSYTVSASQGAATVAVADDDDPPPTPEVSVTAGNGVTEGGDAAFTVTASPAPASSLSVGVTVSASGDYGAATGRRTVTVPTSGSVTFTVGTTDDNADEADGSVTATVNAGSGYTVSASQGAATVAVADDDDPAPEVELTLAVDDASAVEGDVLEFRVRLSEASAEEVRVRWYAAPAYHLPDNRANSSDYQAAEGELTFAPGVTALTGEVWLEQDDEQEPDERFAVEAFLPGSFRVPDAVGTMTIIDDD